MTVQEFYDFCKRENCLQYQIDVQYRDDGGEYYGTDTDLYLKKNDNSKTITL